MNENNMKPKTLRRGLVVILDLAEMPFAVAENLVQGKQARVGIAYDAETTVLGLLRFARQQLRSQRLRLGS